MEQLEVVRMYLFGEVKFLDLLLVLMAIDIITGVFKAIKKGNLMSRKSLFGYARKMLIFAVIILANIMDQILGLNGAIAYGTVIFYIASEGLSIMENLSELGLLIPKFMRDKLEVMKDDQEKDTVNEIKDEFSLKKDKGDER